MPPQLSNLLGGGGGLSLPDATSRSGNATGYASGSSSTGWSFNFAPTLNTGSTGILIFVALLLFGIGVFFRK